MANLLYLTENFSTTLNVPSGIDNSQTTGIVLTTVSGLDTNGGILCLDWANPLDTSTAEYIEYGGISGSELTGVVRGSEGVSAKTHNNGATVVAVVSKSNVNRINDRLKGVDTTGIAPTQIIDSNSNEVVKYGSTASAVNEVTITNAATGNAPTIAPTGGDTNIDLNLTTKGTGVLKVNGVAYAAATTDGWISSSDTWTYASASTFTIAGVDRTAIYTPGTKLKFTQTTVKYAVVLSSAFSTNTTVTIAVNTDYVIANASITSPYYSYQANPQGFPGWFAYAPTIGGFTSAPATPNARYSIQGRTIVIKMRTGNATSNATGFTITSPATARSGSGDVAGQMAQVTDSGTQQTTPGNVYILDNTATINVEKNTGGTGFTASGSKGANFVFQYEI